MATLRDIRRRIRSVKNTRQITRAMQLVASSKMKRAQDRAIAGVPYASYLVDILQSLVNHQEELVHPYFRERPVRNRGVLLLSTDRGLCGPLNSNLFRHVMENHQREGVRYVAVGRKAVQFLSRSRRQLIADFEIDDRVAFRQIRMILEFMMEQFDKEEIDTVEILYPRYISVMVQEPTERKLIPFVGLGEWLERLQALRARDSHIPEALPRDPREIKFEPSLQAILDELPILFIKQQVYQMALSTKASEHSARMVAMKAATDNASNLVEDLTLDYNKARQASITQEVLEIAAATMSNQSA